MAGAIIFAIFVLIVFVMWMSALSEEYVRRDAVNNKEYSEVVR